MTDPYIELKLGAPKSGVAPVYGRRTDRPDAWAELGQINHDEQEQS